MSNVGNANDLTFISREDALAIVRFSKDHVTGIENLPIADVAPVVHGRCKDCKHWDKFVDATTRGFYHAWFDDSYDNDFCSYGERKDR